MARATTAAQDAYLAAFDRRTWVRVKVEDPDGTMVDVGDLEDVDFFDSATIDADADAPISRGTFSFWRAVAEKSLAPLMEGSPLNRDSGGSYAPLINAARAITVEVAPMLPGQTPASGDWILLWDGLIDEWDAAGERIRIDARDRLALLNDTIIKEIRTYGGGSPPTPIQDVMQQILDDNFGSGAWPLTVVGDPDFGITGENGDGYELGNVSVLEALMELADQQGWLLHYLWDAAEGEFRLTYYEPDRANVTPSHTFSTDDYYTVNRAAVGVHGIRNSCEIVYTDSSGARQTVEDERSTSIGIYEERFMRLDFQGSSITMETQAQALLDAVLDDLEDPKALQEIDAAFHWPIELGDVHTYQANGEQYDTDQTYAVFGYTHVIEPTQIRTVIRAAGKPSGGFRRWHRKEDQSQQERTHPRVTDTTYAWSTTGELVVSVQTEGASAVRVAAGASRPTDATIGAATLQEVDADGVAEINLGVGYSGTVVVGAIAYERADGSGFSSDVSISSSFMVEYIEAGGGTIGGWEIDDDEISASSGGFSLNSSLRRLLIGAATAVLTGTGIFAGDVGDGTFDLRVGDPAGSYLHWDESEEELEVVGSITATSGAIGGWDITAAAITSPGGGLALDSGSEALLVGAATDPLTGIGIFIGSDGSASHDLRAGDPSGGYIHWDGSVSTLTVQGAVIQSPGSGTDLALLGWGHDLAFSATDHDTVAWDAGTIRLYTGGTYSISAGNTGTMAAVTYVYLDTATSTTALQTTTTQATAVGANKVLVAVAAPVASGKAAEFQAFGGSGSVGLSKLWTADNLAANTITANEVAVNTLTANEIASLSFSGKTAVFDTGFVGGWALAEGALSSGNVTIDADAEQILMGSATAPLTGIGIFIGLDGSDYEFRVGDPSGEYIHWNGSVFEINAESFTADNPVFSGVLSIQASQGSSLVEIYSEDFGLGLHGGRIDILGTDAGLDMRLSGSTISGSTGVGLTLRANIVGTGTVDVLANLDVRDSLEVGDDLVVLGAMEGTSLTLDQGAGDGAILNLESSDVSHPFTGHAALTTYGTLAKARATTGGTKLEGYSDNLIGVEIIGMAATGDTGKTASDDAAVIIGGWSNSVGGTASAMGINENIVAFRSGGTTRFIIDAEGDFYYDGTSNVYDREDDAALVRALDLALGSPEQLVRSRFDDFVQYNEDDLVRLGILGAPLADGGLTNGAQLLRLHNGAIWQQATRARRLEEALATLLDTNPGIGGHAEVRALLAEAQA